MTGSAGHCDLASHEPAEVLHDGQAEPRSGLVQGAGHPVEPLKDPALFGEWNARTSILDFPLMPLLRQGNS